MGVSLVRIFVGVARSVKPKPTMLRHKWGTKGIEEEFDRLVKLGTRMHNMPSGIGGEF